MDPFSWGNWLHVIWIVIKVVTFLAALVIPFVVLTRAKRFAFNQDGGGKYSHAGEQERESGGFHAF